MEMEVHLPKPGKTVAHWLLEAVFIVVSVGPGFAVAELRESRANRELAGRMMRSVDTEVEHNLATLEQWSAFNRQFANALATADTSKASQAGIDIYLAAKPKLRDGATLDVPLVRRAAWDAALSTGALRLIDYDLVAALSDIYTTQNMYGEELGRLVTIMHESGAYDPATRVTTVRQAAAMGTELSYAQKLLIDLYRQHLPAIRAATTGQ